MPIHRPLSPSESAEADRTRQEVAAAALAAWLLWRRRETEAIVTAGAMSLGSLTDRIRRTSLESIGEIRGTAARGGVESAQRQLPTLALALPALAILRGLYPPTITAGRYARDWGEAAARNAADGQSRELAAVNASRALGPRAAGIAGTEASQAFNSARRQAVRAAAKASGLVALERWVTEFGPNTCERCTFADGETIRLGDSFAEGIPGLVHPHCHCTSIYLYESPETAWLLTS